eukprot:TRINITY_DN4394_c0_g1_i1.p2 TRINITY_DN4394_c0_g1~~TRINITY_DN4394_c0_g1_i1.p2  ORF type:complete len:342 (+),score=78.67 TRINITY_DN4394_c0_g1_i1:1449-2474(+)
MILYSPQEEKPERIYVILITILILTQDQYFCNSVQGIYLPTVTWFKDQYLVNISLSSLITCVLVRTVKLNLYKLQDIYLHTNCLASLTNLSLHYDNIHPYAADCLVKLFVMISKKWFKLLQQQQDNGNMGEIFLMTEEPKTNDLDPKTELETYHNFIVIVLELLNSALTHRLSLNPCLVYALIYHREVFVPYNQFPSLAPLIGNINIATNYFTKVILDTHPNPSTLTSNDILNILHGALLKWNTESLTVFADLHFAYEEEDSQQFFTPYIWSCAYNNKHLSWKASKVKLFGELGPSAVTTGGGNDVVAGSGLIGLPPTVEEPTMVGPLDDVKDGDVTIELI